MRTSDSLSGLASIIVACCDHAESTRQCINALRRYTRLPWELIVIDDGSTDDTSAHLASVRDAAPVPVTVIANAARRGLPAAINQGLKAARGEYLVVVSQDVVVTDGWLDQLIGLVNARRGVDAKGEGQAETGALAGRPSVGLGAGSGELRNAPAEVCSGDEGGSLVAAPTGLETCVTGGPWPTPPGPPFTRGGKGLLDAANGPSPIGLVGPMSNRGAPPQLVERVPYRDLLAMHDFSRMWRAGHRGKWLTVRRLSGSCLLMKRAVYEAIGGLDERAGPEGWADDLADRAQRTGFAMAVAQDLFVHRGHVNGNGKHKHATRKILFSSVHSVLDFSNGASIATMDVLQGLTKLGFECQAFCTAKLDLQSEVSFEKMIGDLHEPYEVHDSACGDDRARILYTRRGQVPITFVRQETTRHTKPRQDEVQTVLRFFARFLDVYQPDVLFTYGGDPVTQGMIAVANRRDIPVVFAIHNFGYTELRHFSHVDYCIVPSQFARRHYRDKLGLECQALPNPVDWERVRVEDPDPRYATFVNPALYKGAYPFVRIAQELGRRRPDIPLLVVESRATKAALGACGLRPSDHPNIQIMPVTTDSRRFYRLTKVLLMPSLWWETQGLVAVEAMLNGIPVIGSDRGALPETLGDGGVLLPLPERLTPESKILPTAEEMEPWLEAIIRLWDDRAWYQEQSNRARAQAECWHPDRLRPMHADFFANVRLRSGPPVIGSPVVSLPSADRAAGDPAETIGLSFVVCVLDDGILRDNMLSSLCLDQSCPYELTVAKNCTSAADGLNSGLERARHEWVVCVHQDVILPAGWDRSLAQQLREAERRFGPIGVAGVYGVGEVIPPRQPGEAFAAPRIGWVVDRERVRRDGPELPAAVAVLDELLLVVRRDGGLRFDPELGFHLYGADLCLQAREKGVAVVALGALCQHNSRSAALPEEFFASAQVFARKWKQRLPIATARAIIDDGGKVHVLGDAADQPGSIAYASTCDVRDGVTARSISV